MSRKQLNRFDILSKANSGFITVCEAAIALGLSERQVKRLKKKVRECGAGGVIHGNSGKRPGNKMPEETKEKILKLRSLPEYQGCNFLHFTEILERDHDIAVSHMSVRKVLETEGIRSPKTKRRKKPHRRRKRRSQAGLLLQVDATQFAWFRGDRAMYSIHGAIDDATGQITGLYMTKNECLYGYFELLRRTIRNYGIPVSIYADKHAIFQSTNAKKHENDPSVTMNDTQLGRSLKELSVTLITARSPQAKGRIERLWGTLQDRLPVEFMIHKIKTVKEANAFLETYIYDFNATFAVEPQNTQNAFRKPDPDENVDLVFCVKDTRIIDAGGVFSYEGKSFKIIEDGVFIPAKAKINVLVGARIGILAAYKGRVMEVLPFVPPKRKKTITPKEPKPQKPRSSDPYLGYDVFTNSGGLFEALYINDAEYYETIRLVEKKLLGKYR